MNSNRLYSFKEWVHIIANYVIYKIQLRIDKYIVQKKALNDAFIEGGFTIKKANNVFILSNNRLKAIIRNNTTDNLVFHQIFIENEYKPIIDYCKKTGFKINTMLDLGSNVGFSSLYFKHIFKDISICAVEPFESNVKAIKANFDINSTKAKIVHGAVWNNDCILGISHDFRDGKEWSISVTEYAPTLDIQGCTINKLMVMNDFETIDFLKIDVEGAESKIFDQGISDVSFLEKVKIIAIEIHDEFNYRSEINTILESYNFKLTNYGELTIGFKNE